MKTERRHELQTNILADTLGKWVKRIRPYGKTIAIAALTLAVAGTVYLVLRYSAGKKNAEAWQSFMSAARNSDLEGFEEIVSTYGNHGAGLWARLAKANILVTDAAADLANDGASEQIVDDFRAAVGAYAEVSEAAQPDSMLYERAQFGMAVAREYLAAVTPRKEINEQLGHILKALRIYDNLTKGSDAIKQAAEANLKLLRKYAPVDLALEEAMKKAKDGEAHVSALREAWETPADNRDDDQNDLMKEYENVVNEVIAKCRWDESKPDFENPNFISWLAMENYKEPITSPGGGGLPGALNNFNPGGANSGLNPGGLNPGGSGLGGSGLGTDIGKGLNGGLGSETSPGEDLLNNLGKGIESKGKDDSKSKGKEKETPRKDDAFPINKNKDKTKGKAPAKKSGDNDTFPVPKKDKGGKGTGLNPPANKKTAPEKTAAKKKTAADKAGAAKSVEKSTEKAATPKKAPEKNSK